jgi:hypothetical protein
VMFQVTAAPTGAGMQTGTISIDTDIPGATPHAINLAVNGLAAGVTPTPAMLDLGSNPINQTTIGQQVHLSNCATASITTANARITGPDATDFAIVAQPDSSTIAPASSATWLIVLQAHSVGPKVAAFQVDYDTTTATIDLVGEGLGMSAGSNDAGTKSSYYDCSAGRPGTAWPIAIGVVLILRRRRRGRCRCDAASR